MRSAEFRTWGRITVGVLLSLAVSLALASQAGAVLLFGLTTDGHVVVQFDSATPQTIIRAAAITGLQPDERIVGFDVRPATGDLYGVGIVAGATDTGRLYIIDPFTGAATQVGTTPFATDLLSATAYGIDFNPVPDRLRVVSVAGENLRVVPGTGALAGNDTNLNPGTPVISGVAYDRSVAGATVTTLFGIDTNTAQLVRIGGIDGLPLPNGGVVTAIGLLGINAAEDAGFDIDPVSGTLFAALTLAAPPGQSGLYTLNATTGAATLVGPIGDGNLYIGGLAVAPATSITISPPSGTYATTQAFDLTLFVQSVGSAEVGSTINGGQITFDGVDVTTALVGCLIPGTRVPLNGLTARCPGLKGGLLGLGTHTLIVTLSLNGGPSARASVVWTVVQTTEP